MALAALASFAVLGLATASPLRDTTAYTFKDYKAEFGKAYEAQEDALRYQLFTDRLRQINTHNAGYAAGNHTWYAAVNEFTDWTEDEFNAIKTGKAVHNVFEHPTAQLDMMGANPDRIDWREKQVVTDVKNQGGCGSCWAFAAIEVIESHYAIATGKLLTLSPQSFVNCVKNPHECGGQGGCQGATFELAYNLTAETGVALESDMPYLGHDAPCQAYKAAVKGTGYVKLPVNDANALETALATKGPVAITVSAGWMFYGGGIFSGACSLTKGCTLNHGVVAEGYDKTGEGYWLVRNSWGDKWGEGGYIRLSRKNDATIYTDSATGDGVACKPYPATQKVAGESGILFDTAYPTGLMAADVTDELVV